MYKLKELPTDTRNPPLKKPLHPVMQQGSHRASTLPEQPSFQVTEQHSALCPGRSNHDTRGSTIPLLGGILVANGPARASYTQARES